MRIVLTLSLVFCGLSFSLCQTGPSGAHSTLQSVKDLREFKPNGSRDPVPVHFRAVVTFYDSPTPDLFVQDATAGVWVDLRGIKAPAPSVGQLLDIRGEASVGSTLYLVNPRWKVLGSAPLPKPVHLSYEQAAAGTFDGQWTEMEGIVHSIAKQPAGNFLVLDVATPTGLFTVLVPDYRAALPDRLMDAKVRFTGVCATAFNMLVPSLANAKVIEAAPSDSSSLATTSLNQIGRLYAQATDVHRVKVRGVITAQFPGQGLFLMDSTGGVYIESPDDLPTLAGDEVEVMGFPARGNYGPVLTSTVIRPTGKHQTILPMRIGGKTALKGGIDGRLVTIGGTVKTVTPDPGGYSLVLESEDDVKFAVRFATAPSLQAAPDLDSKLILTGICSTKMTQKGKPSAFEIVLRSPEDVLLVSPAPWLTNRRAALLVSGIVLVTAMGTGWVIILRRQVRRQTELIKVRLENEVALEERYRRMFARNLTGLYIATSDGHIIDCNSTCARILGYPDRFALLEDLSNVELVTAQFHEHLSDTASEGENQVLNAEYRINCPDGSWKSVLVNVRGFGQTENAPAIIEGGLLDITARKAAEDQVKYLAYYDSLTGLANRSLLKDRLGNAIAAARRRKQKVGVLYVDLNRFKIINDSHGHATGDLLLKDAAARLKELSREEDTVARIGGDEFIIVTPSLLESSDAAIAAERIANGMNKEFLVAGNLFKVPCSIGISIFPDHGSDGETLIRNADAAMYSAKEGGGCTFQFFTEEINAQVVEKFTLELRLRAALENQELSLMYQPQMGLATRKITGFEALLRWEHPEMGLVSPERFISVAESSGLIIPIGEWVLRTACIQARRWLDKGLRVPAIAVNVSAMQFRHVGFCELVRAVLDDTALPAQCLELELTESVLLGDGDSISSLLDELRGMGVKLAIDDFGKGYSSLGYLRQLAVGKLKIDGAFIKDVATSPDDATIATAIIEMSRALNLKVVAECVETEAQVEFLRSRRCDEIQGYYFSKPLSAVDAEQWLMLDRSEAAAEITSAKLLLALPIEEFASGP